MSTSAVANQRCRWLEFFQWSTLAQRSSTRALTDSKQLVVLNESLQVFFERNGVALATSRKAEDYRPGDLVTWMLSANLPHIGIVVARRSSDGERPLVVHNIGEDP